MIKEKFVSQKLNLNIKRSERNLFIGFGRNFYFKDRREIVTNLIQAIKYFNHPLIHQNFFASE